MAYVLELVQQGLELKDKVDSSQLPVFAHKHFRPQHLVKACNVDEVEVGNYMSFICKNIQEAKPWSG